MLCQSIDKCERDGEGMTAMNNSFKNQFPVVHDDGGNGGGGKR